MIQFNNTEFDLGDVTYGQNISVNVTINNNGTLPVELIPANSSCSCTSGTVDPNVLQPGTSGLFTISFNSNKAGKGSNQAKSITLNYEVNRETFSQVFRIKANVL